MDSTPLRVYRKKRIFNHKVFKGIAQKGKSTLGYFNGFKLHIATNETGQVIVFMTTTNNTYIRTPLKDGNMLNNVWGKLYEDKGYVSKTLFENLFNMDTFFTTGKRKNTKNQLINLFDKIVLGISAQTLIQDY